MRPPVGEQSKPPRKLSEVQELHVGQTPQTGKGGREMLDLTEYADMTIEQIVIDIMMIIEEVMG